MILNVQDDNGTTIGYIQRDNTRADRTFKLFLKVQNEEAGYYKINPRDLIELSEMLKSMWS